jgi:hypothetical protein
MGRSERPYFQTSIVQLEAMFDQDRSNIRTLGALDHELSYRTTERAAKLRAKVGGQLAAVAVKQAAVGSVGSVPTSSEHPASVIAFPRAQRPTSSAAQADAPIRAASPPTMDLGELPTIASPRGSNEPSCILAAWTALEALSPQTYRRPDDLAAGDRRCVADLTTGRVPWGSGERSQPKRQLYYQIILGAIPMDRATEEMVKAFGEDEERGSRVREKAAIAAILVDKNGVIVEENGIAVSSFAWALPLALKLKLGALGVWPRIEPKIIEKLDDILRRVDEHGAPIPVDLRTIEMAHRWLVAQFGLADHLIEAPTFALRIYHYFKAKNVRPRS